MVPQAALSRGEQRADSNSRCRGETVLRERRGEPLITRRVMGFRARLEASLARDNERREKDREQINSADCPDAIRLNRA